MPTRRIPLAERRRRSTTLTLPLVAVAQVARASGCGPEGREFESPRSPQVRALCPRRKRAASALRNQRTTIGPSDSARRLASESRRAVVGARLNRRQLSHKRRGRRRAACGTHGRRLHRLALLARDHVATVDEGDAGTPHSRPPAASAPWSRASRPSSGVPDGRWDPGRPELRCRSNQTTANDRWTSSTIAEASATVGPCRSAVSWSCVSGPIVPTPFL